MKYYVGLDLHSNNTYLGIINQEGKRFYKARLRNFINLILAELEPYKEDIEGLVVESTFNWYWLVDGLMEAGYKRESGSQEAICLTPPSLFGKTNSRSWPAGKGKSISSKTTDYAKI